MSYDFYYPPNFTRRYCTIKSPEFIEDKLVALIRDKEGNIVKSFEFKRIDETSVYCALITTPEEEGVYVLEVGVVGPDNNLKLILEYHALIVSNTESPFGLLREIKKKLESIQGQ